MMLLLQIVLLGFIAGTTLLCSSIATAAKIAFVPVVILAAIPMIKSKKLTLISAFCAAFAYMVLPEAALGEGELAATWGARHVLAGYRVLVFSFIAVNVGFLIFRKQLKPRERISTRAVVSPPGSLEQSRKVFIFLTIFCVVIFAPMIAYGLTTGRGSSSLHNPDGEGGLLFSIGILGYFLSALTYVVCGFWGYYYSTVARGARAILMAALWSSPIFFIGVASGTRYMLCFMLSATFFPWVYHLTMRKVKRLVVCGVFLMLLFSAMKSSRYSGFDFSAAFAQSQGIEENVGLDEKILSKGSPEGLVRNMAMIDTWTTSHPHTHGKSIGFLGIFWVPRFIWQDKPTQIDHWLIREYESGFGSGYSTASSFCGELFMDFGYFCLLACIFLGALMAKLDRFIERKLVFGGFAPTVMSGLFLGWAFFMTRSILTASYPLFLGGALVFFFNKFVLRERKREITPPRNPIKKKRFTE